MVDRVQSIDVETDKCIYLRTVRQAFMQRALLHCLYYVNVAGHMPWLVAGVVSLQP